MKKNLIALILSLAIIAVAVWYAQSARGADELPVEGAMSGFTVEKPRLPVKQGAFFDGSGNVRHFRDFGNRVLLVNFWATWCGPCVEEMPSLNRLQEELGGADFQVVAISTDAKGKDAVQPFLRDKLGLNALDIFLDPKMQLARSFGIKGLPTSFLIDAKGRLVGSFTGATDWSSDEAKALIRHVIMEGATDET